MNHQECGLHENIIRALRSSDWDPKNKRFSSDVLKGPNTSVGRLIILPLNDLFEIFHRELDRLERPPNIVKWAGEINVGLLKHIGINYKNKPTKITVLPKPLISNPAHAEIPQKLSRPLCLKILEYLTIRKESCIQLIKRRLNKFMSKLRRY